MRKNLLRLRVGLVVDVVHLDLDIHVDQPLHDDEKAAFSEGWSVAEETEKILESVSVQIGFFGDEGQIDGEAAENEIAARWRYFDDFPHRVVNDIEQQLAHGAVFPVRKRRETYRSVPSIS